MASAKRELPRSYEFQSKKARISQNEPSQSVSRERLRVTLNPADSDIDFNIEENGLKGSALYEEGFAYCWSGSRANIGITGGKYCFGCKIISDQQVVMEDTPLDQKHVTRIGISRGDDEVRNLGESTNSFGFGGTAKFSNSGKFFDYGEKFGVGDTIVCVVDLENRPMASIGFFKNGKWLGLAKTFDAGPSGLDVMYSPTKKLKWEQALFPHVLLKNTIVQLQFSINDGLIQAEGYKPWSDAITDGNSVMGPTFSNQLNRELMMMVGLPASGKTSWAQKFVKEHPDKRYIILGTDLVLEQMKLPGLLRKRNYSERFKHLMDRATRIFNVLLSRASKISRNYIIDQTNVYKSARKRKLKPFLGYKKIAVVVFQKPEELASRARKQLKETGKEVPPEAVNEMLANFTLPTCMDMPGADEYFDQVLYVELSRAESQISLDEMKHNMRMKPHADDCGNKSHIFQNEFSSPSGMSYSTHSSHDLRPRDFDHRGSSSAYNRTNINDFHYNIPTNNHVDVAFPNCQMHDTHNHIGIPSGGGFLHKVQADYSTANLGDSTPTSPPRNPCNNRYIFGLGGAPYDHPATRHPTPTYQPAPSPSSYLGLHGFHMPRHPQGPHQLGNFPFGVQHPIMPPLRHFHEYFVSDSQHPRVRPPPHEGI